MKSQSYNTFWQHIHQSAKENGFPLRVMFELTYRCNFRCRHCYVPNSYRKKEELKTKEIFSILDQLAEMGCFYLGFTGGEPFMRKDILDILWYAKKQGFELIIYTNGARIRKSRLRYCLCSAPKPPEGYRGFCKSGQKQNFFVNTYRQSMQSLFFR